MHKYLIHHFLIFQKYLKFTSIYLCKIRYFNQHGIKLTNLINKLKTHFHFLRNISPSLFGIGVVIILLVVIAVSIFYPPYNGDNENFINITNGSIELSYDLYLGDESCGYSTVKISQSTYNNIKGYKLNISTVHDADTKTTSTYLAYTTNEFEPLYVLYKDNSTAPMIPERILGVKFKNNSASTYSKYIEITGKGLSKSYSVIERNETIELKKNTYTQVIFRFLKIRDIPLMTGYKGQFTLVNQNMTIEVIGKEQVNTPAGSFECWKIREILYKSNETESSIIWHSIDHAIPVKIKDENTGLYQVLSNFNTSSPQ
ncbi:MAG: hypothetical protein CVT88_07385 [Candidatus Altiarchaeales archaeon HGW-Altiarchaeales-1]|nr:MAG: hypothetical protein CVT88_07385 [Candidatus Altiarchaeales archaeon HGW-Altiarchaeales-1]